MRTILVLNAKGGSGKSTLATNIAGYYADHGYVVTLADFDPQGSSLDWLAVRPEARPHIRGVDASNGRCRIRSGTEVCVIDAPSRTHASDLRGLIRRAQSVVVPVVPSPVDIRAAERFLDELFSLRDVEENAVKIATVANRAREGTIAAEDLEDYLGGLKLPSKRKLPFLTILRASVNYLHAAERGLSIFEFAPAATAIDRETWAPLTRWLNSQRSLPEDE